MGELVAGGMAMGSERTWGGWDWVRASSDCPSVFFEVFEVFVGWRVPPASLLSRRWGAV